MWRAHRHWPAVAFRFAASILAETAFAAEPNRPGWILEHFGRDVSILRTHQSPQDAGTAGRIFLSCDGKAKRVRLGLPARHAGGSGLAPNGTLLLRPSGVADGPHVVLRYTAQDARTLVVQMEDDATDGQGFAELSRLLASRPPALDLLVRDPGETPLGRIGAFVLPLRYGDGDREAIERFATACQQADRRTGKPGRSP